MPFDKNGNWIPPGGKWATVAPRPAPVEEPQPAPSPTLLERLFAAVKPLQAGALAGLQVRAAEPVSQKGMGLVREAEAAPPTEEELTRFARVQPFKPTPLDIAGIASKLAPKPLIPFKPADVLSAGLAAVTALGGRPEAAPEMAMLPHIAAESLKTGADITGTYQPKITAPPILKDGRINWEALPQNVVAETFRWIGRVPYIEATGAVMGPLIEKAIPAGATAAERLLGGALLRGAGYGLTEAAARKMNPAEAAQHAAIMGLWFTAGGAAQIGLNKLDSFINRWLKGTKLSPYDVAKVWEDNGYTVREGSEEYNRLLQQGWKVFEKNGKPYVMHGFDENGNYRQLMVSQTVGGRPRVNVIEAAAPPEKAPAPETTVPAKVETPPAPKPEPIAAPKPTAPVTPAVKPKPTPKPETVEGFTVGDPVRVKAETTAYKIDGFMGEMAVLVDNKGNKRFASVKVLKPITEEAAVPEVTEVKEKRVPEAPKAEVAEAPKPTMKPEKPYVGLRPGTPQWMDVWRKHPELQEEMLEYQKGLKPEPTRVVEGEQAFAGVRPTLARAQAEPTTQIRRQDIVKHLEEKLGVPIRTGRFRTPALGIFKVKPEVIRTRLAEDLPVIAHEVGHYLDKTYSLQNPQFDGELMALGRPVSKKSYTKSQVRGEGVAEFMRLYLTDPAEAQRQAPNYFKAFEERIDPEAKDILLQARKDIENWVNQPAKARILGAMSIGERKARPVTIDRLYTMAVDELRPLEKAVSAMSAGKKLPITEDPFKTAWLARGWTGKAETFLHYDVVDENFNKVADSLESILEPIGDKLDDFRAYAVARRARELHDRGITTGIEPADIAEVLKDESPEFKEAFQKLVKYQDAVLEQTLVKSGVISKEAAQAMRAMNQDYVPFYRLFDESLATAGFGGKGYANLPSPVKRIKGSGRTIIDPLEGIIKNTYVLVNLSERNRVGRSLVELAEKNEGLGKWVEEIPTPMRATKFQLEEIKRQLQDAGADVKGLDLEQVATIFRPSFFAPAKENILTVFRNGKPAFYQMDPELYRSMLSLDKESSTLLVKILSYPASILRAGATLSPEFIVRNPVRDQWTAYLHSKFGYRPAVDLAKGLFHAFKKDDLYWKWQASGGGHGSLVSLDRDYLQQSIKELLRKGAKEDARYLASHPLELLRGLSELFEQATRLGEFQRGIEKGGGSLEVVLEAALASRDVTVDFARKGTATGPINRIVAFFNAAIQGMDKMRRAFGSNPKQYTVRALMAITLPSIILFLQNYKDERYKELPQWQKDLFWIILTKNNIYRVPKPFEAGILFGTVPERIMQWILEQDPKAFDELGKTITEAALPSIIPTALVPWIESLANKSLYTGVPIVPEREKKLPPEQQFGPYTSETLKLVGNAIKRSPRMMEHVIGGYTGGLGRTGLRVADYMLEAVGAVEPVPKPAEGLAGVPGIKAFVARPFEQAQSVDRFYDLLEQAEMEFKRSGKKVVPFKLKQMRKTADELSELRAKQREVEQSKELSPEEKRRKLDELNQKMIREARKRLE